MKAICHQCQEEFEVKFIGAYNRSIRLGRTIYCGRTCAGIGRRKFVSKEEKARLKAEYDKIYRSKNIETIKKKKADYFQKSYDPVKARVYRKKIVARHNEYCRRPEYKKWKAQYDKKYLAKKHYGPFWEVSILCLKLEKEVDRYEANINNQSFGKSTKRKRQWKNSQHQT